MTPQEESDLKNAAQDTGSYQPLCMGPSALGVDDAISVLQESIDWMRLRNYLLPGVLLTHHASDCTSLFCLCPSRAACALCCVRSKCRTVQSASQMYASSALSHLICMGRMHL